MSALRTLTVLAVIGTVTARPEPIRMVPQIELVEIAKLGREGFLWTFEQLGYEEPSRQWALMGIDLWTQKMVVAIIPRYSHRMRRSLKGEPPPDRLGYYHVQRPIVTYGESILAGKRADRWIEWEIAYGGYDAPDTAFVCEEMPIHTIIHELLHRYVPEHGRAGPTSIGAFAVYAKTIEKAILEELKTVEELNKFRKQLNIEKRDLTNFQARVLRAMSETDEGES